MADDFPQNVRDFIDRHIESLAQLEVLLIMHRDPQRAWNARQIGEAFYIPTDSAAALLADLVQRKFIRLAADSTEHYCFDPSDPQGTCDIELLDSAYQERRVAVISLIYSKPVNKVQTFADAFRLRKET